MFRSAWIDLRLAIRSLRRTPGFTLSAVATLGLALGAAIAIFTVVNATLLTPPPYPDPDRLVLFTTVDTGGLATTQELAFLRERARTLSVVAGQRTTPGWNLVAGNRAEFVDGLEVTDGYFEVHQTPLLLGRGISSEESRLKGPRAVVLSEPLWRRLYDGRRDVLGEVVELGGRAYQIVGVAPAHFRSVPPAQVWSSLQIAPQANAGVIRILGRVAPGLTHRDAVAELNTMRAELRALTQDDGDRTDFLTWRPHQEWFAARSRELMLILLAAVGALLLVACVNVAGLQVARALGRARESAARAALGASRLRLFREAFSESLLLVAMASAMGLLLAAWGTQTLLSLLPPELVADLLAGQPVAIDARVVSGALLIAAASAIVSGVAPAMASATVDLRTATSEARVTTGRRALWLRRGFAVTQIALALVLLVGAGLLMRTFATLRSTELGFAPDDLLVGEMAIQENRVDATSFNLFVEDALARIQELDGVAAVSVASAVPVDRSLNLSVEAHGESRLRDHANVDWAYTTAGYFDLFAIPLRAGRMFDPRDGQTSAPVAVVNAAFARAFFGRENVVGETIRTRAFGDPAREIVGVVGDVRARSGSSFGTAAIALAAPPPPTVYVPFGQVPAAGFQMVHQFTPMRWIVRTREGVAGIPEAVRETVRRQDSRRPFKRFLAMDQIIGRDVGVHRFLAMLLTVFAATALSLAALGLYALVSQLVAHRRPEIGIRMALGATTTRVMRIFLSESVRLTAAGVVVGLLAAPYLTRTLTMFLVGVTPIDTATFVGVAAALLATALLAAAVPARRAAQLDPAMSLRSE
jgi:predicted permease